MDEGGVDEGGVDDSEVVVVRNERERRWEARVGDELAGFARYRLEGDVVVFTHTEVDRHHEGRGIAGTIARTALDEVAATGTLRVRPSCPFVRGWIERHPAYAGLVVVDDPSPSTST